MKKNPEDTKLALDVTFSTGKVVKVEVDTAAAITDAKAYGSAVIAPAMRLLREERKAAKDWKMTFQVGATPAGAPAGFAEARAAWESATAEKRKAAKDRSAKRDAKRAERKAARRHAASAEGRGERTAAKARETAKAGKSLKFSDKHKAVLEAALKAVFKRVQAEALATVKAL